MNCSFSNNCSGDCPKYNLCMYNSLQNQLSEINNQLSFVLSALTKLTCESNTNNERLTIAEANLIDTVSMLIQLSNDSETKH